MKAIVVLLGVFLLGVLLGMAGDLGIAQTATPETRWTVTPVPTSEYDPFICPPGIVGRDGAGDWHYQVLTHSRYIEIDRELRCRYRVETLRVPAR
jgi:hypothetical protein